MSAGSAAYSYSEAPEVVTHHVRSESMSNTSLTTIPTYESHYEMQRQNQTEPATPDTKQSMAGNAAANLTDAVKSAISNFNDVPWEKVGGLLTKHSHNPGLLIVLVFALYLLYSIIMTKALYLLIAVVVGILAANGRKMFTVQKQAEIQGEYMRSIASKLQSVEMLPPGAGGFGSMSTRMIMPSDTSRVEEIS